MTGSGSSCFGVFKEKKDAEYVENDLKIKHPDWWTCSAKII
jgi:4-diphosphocytidyl-2C-methyl-D-erythritol kinase